MASPPWSRSTPEGVAWSAAIAATRSRAASSARARHAAVRSSGNLPRACGSSKLAVAEDIDADPLLQFQHAQDRCVLELAQVFKRQPTCAVRRVRLLDFGRPQKTADLVCSIRSRHQADAAAAALAAALARSSSINVRRRILPD